MAAGVVAVVYPLLEGQHRGWPVWCWLLLGGGLVALVGLFVVDSRHQASGAATLLPTPLLKVPAYGAGIAVQLFFSAAMSGSVIVLALWVQSGQGWSPIHAGLVHDVVRARDDRHRADVGRRSRRGSAARCWSSVRCCWRPARQACGSPPTTSSACSTGPHLAARSAAARRGHGARPARRTADQRRAGRRAGRAGRVGVRPVQHRPAARRGARRRGPDLGLLRPAARARLRVGVRPGHAVRRGRLSGLRGAVPTAAEDGRPRTRAWRSTTRPSWLLEARPVRVGLAGRAGRARCSTPAPAPPAHDCALPSAASHQGCGHAQGPDDFAAAFADSPGETGSSAGVSRGSAVKSSGSPTAGSRLLAEHGVARPSSGRGSGGVGRGSGRVRAGSGGPEPRGLGRAVVLELERGQRAERLGDDHCVVAGLQPEVGRRVDVGTAVPADRQQGGPVLGPQLGGELVDRQADVAVRQR